VDEPTGTKHLDLRVPRLVVVDVVGREVRAVLLERRDEVRQVLPVCTIRVGKKALSGRRVDDREGPTHQPLKIAGRRRELRRKIASAFIDGEFRNDWDGWRFRGFPVQAADLDAVETTKPNGPDDLPPPGGDGAGEEVETKKAELPASMT
jgi:hypothetical protein